MDRTLAIRKKAQQLAQKGQIDAALKEFDRLFDSGDRDPYDYILAADLMAKRGSMSEAVGRYKQAIEEYARAELYKNAIAVCKKILRLSKEDLGIHRTLGELYSREGLLGDAQVHYLEFAEGSIRRHDFDASLDVLDIVLELSPDNEELSEKYVEISLRADEPERGGRELLRRAGRAEQDGRGDDATELRERALKIAPGLDVASVDGAGKDRAPALDGEDSDPEMGAIYAQTPSSEAIYEPSARSVDLPGAHAIDPGPLRPGSGALSHEELAVSYRDAGQRDRAVEEYWHAAELAFAHGESDEARRLLGALLDLAPTHEASRRRMVDIAVERGNRAEEARARYELADLYLGREEWALARAECVRVIELDPENSQARLRVQRLDAALDGSMVPAGEGIDLDSIDAPKPNASVRVRDEHSTTTEGLIDLEEIIDEFKAGVTASIGREDHESHYDLGMAYMEMGLHDEAIAEFQVASSGGPMQLKCLEMIALCYLEKSDPGTAVQELSRALEIPSHGPEETISIRYNLGVACERLGQLDRALQHYEEVYLLNPEFLKVTTKVRELKHRIGAAGSA